MPNKSMPNKTTIIAFALISTILFSSCEGKKKPEPQISEASRTAIIKPPIPKLDIAYQNFTVEPDSATVLTTPRGTKIRIPSNAFLDKDGNIVKDKVDITFREFYSPLDFYLAGIPMTYDENGIEKVFESGGMVEINATSNKNEVFVNPKNKIKVDMLSWTKSEEFNAYDLDKISGKWIEKGKDSISLSEKEEELKSTPTIPPMPRVSTSNSFKIEVDKELHPEIAIYENVLFEPVDPLKCSVGDAQDYKINPLKNGIYEVISILKIGNYKEEHKCECYLAFEKGKDYNKALKIYQKKYASLIKNREVESKIIRTLEINNFGFVNCDRPINYPQGGEFNPIFVDEKGNSLHLTGIVLVESNNNALFRYTSTVKYNPSNKNVLWGITNKSKIAYIKDDDFSTIINKSSGQKIKMHLIEKTPETYEDLKKILF
ncbi:hypothetical protein [Flavobacterium sp. M31R6]|uniref:hypothetical protein n=1 Tax=Flavobacterium sp. M31R6 TaxID=2739062 RepID=UPI001567E698|nr:hypothetical protein [Flavobacterium sp. M31R6]QKJ62181.1 hypothetical protein HQN62_03190 [Flavobacterium sp. M31R6]